MQHRTILHDMKASLVIESGREQLARDASWAKIIECRYPTSKTVGSLAILSKPTTKYARRVELRSMPG